MPHRPSLPAVDLTSLLTKLLPLIIRLHFVTTITDKIECITHIGHVLQLDSLVMMVLSSLDVTSSHWPSPSSNGMSEVSSLNVLISYPFLIPSTPVSSASKKRTCNLTLLPFSLTSTQHFVKIAPVAGEAVLAFFSASLCPTYLYSFTAPLK